jgi:hypothetical protein
VTTSPTNKNATATITGRYAGVAKTATLTVKRR